MTARLFLAGIVLTLFACGTADTTSVRLDFRSVAAQQTELPIDEITVRVSGPGGDPVVASVPVSDLSMQLEVPPGQRLFEVLGQRTDLSAPRPTYFGDGIRRIAPQTPTDVLIPLFPAGQLLVFVNVADGTPPPDTNIRFVPQNPMPDQSASYLAPFRFGRLERILPIGTYGVQAEVTFDGSTYVTVGDEITVTIEHGEVRVERIDI